MVRKIGKINRRGSSAWLVRIYIGRVPNPGSELISSLEN
jgi:hypothetical protein